MTTTVNEVRISMDFTATLDACPSCEVEQEFGGENGAHCRSCGYHAGAELSETWTDLWNEAKDLPVGEITNTIFDEQCYCDIEIPESATSEQIAALKEWIMEIGGKVDLGRSEGGVTFQNNTDYPKPLFFFTAKSFIEFANGYISAPERWGNLYSQQIKGIEIEWSEEDGEWVVA